MKKFMWLMFGCLFMCGVELLALVASPTPGLVSDPGNPAPDWILSLVSNYPKLTTLLVIIGTLRLVLKPTFAYLHTILPAMGLVAFDSEVAVIEQSKFVSALYFVLDYIGSVKVPVAVAQGPVVVTKPSA
jgi:hypothetical protein